MRKVVNSLKLLSLFFTIFFYSAPAAVFTATTASGSPGNWNDGGTWGNASPGVVNIDFPGVGDDANIPGGKGIVIPSGYAANAASVVINSDALWTSSNTTLSLADATSSLALSGNLTMNAPATALTIGTRTGSVTMNGGIITTGGNLTATAVGTETYGAGRIYNQLITTGAGTLTITGNTTLSNGGSANATSKINMNTAGSILSMAGSVSINVLDNGTGANGTIFYNGAGSQDILSSITYYNLTISGAGLKTLDGNTPVLNMLTLTSSKIDLAGNTLTLGAGALTAGTLVYTSGHMYGGSFKRWFLGPTTIADGSVTGLFPMGDDINYRPFYVSRSVAASSGGTITVSHTDAGTVSDVSFADGASTVLRRHDAFWSCVTGDGLAGGTYNLRIEGTGFGTIGNVDDLRLTLSGSTVGTAGTNAGTTNNPQVNRVGLLLAELSGNFYVGSVNATNSPLPVELISFDVVQNDGLVNITWTTAAEINNDYFSIERSTDGIHFELIKIVDGAGNSASTTTYRITDELEQLNSNVWPVTVYYRLRQTDYNGQFTYSNIALLNINYDLLLEVFPNPGIDYLYLLSSGLNKFNTLSIYSSSGMLVYKVENLMGSFGKFSIPVYDLSSGLYYLVISTSDKKILTKSIEILR